MEFHDFSISGRFFSHFPWFPWFLPDGGLPVWKMAAILSRPQGVKKWLCYSGHRVALVVHRAQKSVPDSADEWPTFLPPPLESCSGTANVDGPNYLNQFWLFIHDAHCHLSEGLIIYEAHCHLIEGFIIYEAQWHLAECNFTKTVPDHSLQIV